MADSPNDIDIDIETDEILNLEQEQYQIGYQEGVEQSAKEQYLEGKQFGYQTGFQRFLIVGYIRGLVEDWESHISEYGSIESTLRNHLKQLKNCLDGLLMINDEDSVAQFEIQLKKVRNKLRVICQLNKESWKINDLDKLVEQVGGSMQVSEDVVEMW